MDFETTYTSPRNEAVRTLSGIGNHQRFAVRKDALAIAEEKQARALGYEAPTTRPAAPKHLRRWFAGLFVVCFLAAIGCMALLLAMGSNSR